MSKKPLTLKFVATEMDGGRHAVMFDKLVQTHYGDILDRPNVLGERTVIMKVTLKPEVENDEDGKPILEAVRIRFHFEGKMPKFQSRNYSAEPGRGGLLIEEYSPEEHRQRSLAFEPGPQGKVTDDEEEPEEKEDEDANVG